MFGRSPEHCRPGILARLSCVLALGLIALPLHAGGSLAVRIEAVQAARAESRAPVRDLQRDEQRGGHTLARHVGRTDAELRQRLQREPQISAASTYNDAETASAAVGSALAQSDRRVRNWEARQGPRPNLVLNYVQTTGPPIGRSLARGARETVPCRRALVVLRWDDRRGEWFVLTSYPEASR